MVKLDELKQEHRALFERLVTKHARIARCVSPSAPDRVKAYEAAEIEFSNVMKQRGLV